MRWATTTYDRQEAERWREKAKVVGQLSICGPTAQKSVPPRKGIVRETLDELALRRAAFIERNLRAVVMDTETYRRSGKMTGAFAQLLELYRMNVMDAPVLRGMAVVEVQNAAMQYVINTARHQQ